MLRVSLHTSLALLATFATACCPGASDPPPAPVHPETVSSFPSAPAWVDVNTYRVTWDPAHGNGHEVNNYAVYALRCDGTYAEQRALTQSGATTIDFGPMTEDAGQTLEPGYSYKFAVRARTDVGGWDQGGWNINVASPCSTLDPLGVPVDDTPPPKPVEAIPPKTVTSFPSVPERVDETTIRVTWNPPEDAQDDIVDYEVYAFLCDGTFLGQTARTGSGAATIDFGPVTEKNGNGLALGSTYKFTVRARNDAGWDGGSWITNTFSECSAPDPG